MAFRYGITTCTCTFINFPIPQRQFRSNCRETAIFLRILCSFRFLCSISNICAKIFACPNERRDKRKRLKKRCLQCVWLPLWLLCPPAAASSQPADESGRQSKDIIKQSSNKLKKEKKTTQIRDNYKDLLITTMSNEID